MIVKQETVIDLQKELITAKNQQLADLKQTVVTSVEDRVKLGLKSYSDLTQHSNDSAAGPLLDHRVLKCVVVKDVAAGEELMIFGLAQDTEHDISEKVSFERAEKP